MRSTLIRFLAVAMLAAVSASAASLKVEETIVGPAYDSNTTYVLSPKGLRLATVHAKGSRFAVTIDGVESPAYDEVLKTAVAYTTGGFEGFSPFGGETSHVAFSPDGRRHAYTARSGKETIVVVDGKEIFRTGQSGSESPVGLLTFSPEGKRVLFIVRAEDAAKEVLRDRASSDFVTQTTAVRLMIDGKPASPPYVQSQMALPVFNADGSRWALLAGRPGNSGVGFLILDGKDAGDTGNAEHTGAVEQLKENGRETRRLNYAHPRFTPDGRRLVSLRFDPANNASHLLVDGKPILTDTKNRITGFILSPRGEVAAIATNRDGKRQLHIDGKPMAGAENAYHVVFSPDGKRWAAACGELLPNIGAGPESGIHASTAWVVVDGRKHANYGKVSGLSFTADSSRCVYVAEVRTPAGVTRKFVVINGEEDAGHQNLRIGPVFSKTGHRVAYAGEVMGGKVQVYLDGKPLPPSSNAHNLTLSPDGKRHAYYAAESSLGSSLVIDGEPKARGGGFGAPILFSEDGGHVATIASPPKGGGGPMLCVDGEFVSLPKTLQNPQPIAFTADGRNIVVSGIENGPEGRPARTYYINGGRAAQFSAMAASSFTAPGQPPPWEAQPDGSVLFIGAEPTGTYGGVMKRIKATPAPGTSIATWIADVKAAKEKEIADADAAREAKKKAATDAAAQRKADQDAALSKRKADQEAALAKRKADMEKRQRDAENARRAKQGLPPLPAPFTSP